VSESQTPPPAPVRRRRWPRVLLGLGAVFTVLLLGAVGFGWYVLATQGGLRFALVQAERFTNGLIHVGSANGTVLGELDLRDVRYTGSDGTVVTIKHLHLRYTPRTLLKRRLHVQVFEVETLDVAPGASAPKAGPQPATTLPVRLPIDIIVDALTLDSFSLRASGKPDDPNPFVIEHAEFSGQWLGDTIDVQQLSTALAFTGPLQARARARMTSDHIDFEDLSIQGPGSIHAVGSFGIDTAKSDLKLEFEQLHWPLVLADKQPAQVGDIHGNLLFKGTLDQYRYELATNANMQGRAAMLGAKGSGSLQDVQIDQLQLDTLAGDGTDTARNAKTAGLRGSISATGYVAWSPQLKADLKAVLTHVDPSLLAVGMPGDINGQLDTHTTLADERPEILFTADIQRSFLRGQPFSLKAEGSTDTRQAALKNLLLLAGKGQLKAQGEVAWAPRLSANLDAQIAKLDPGLFAADWPGEINGTLKVTTVKGPDAPIRFDAQIADSRLRGYPLKLDAQGAVASEKTVTLQQLKLNSGRTSLTASGQVTPPFDASGKFESPDLAALYPKLSGKAAFDFALTGSIEQPHLITHGEASALKFGEQTLSRLSWSADVDPKVDSKVTVTATDADVGLHLNSVTLLMTGLEVYHRLELTADTERGKANLALQGGFDRKRFEWGGELAALGFAPGGMGEWSLEKSAGVLLGRTRRALETACLHGAEGRACFNLEQNVLSDGTRVGWNIDRLLLAAAQPFLPSDYQLSGSVDGEGHINFTGGDIVEAMASLNLHETKLEVPQAPPFLLETGSLRAEQRDGRLHGTVELKAVQGGITADVSAASGTSFNERALSGAVTIDFPSLAFLEPLLPQLSSLDGKLDGKFDIAGTPARPRFAGQVLLSEAHAKLVIAGIELKDVQLKVVADQDKPMTLDGQLKSGDGSMQLSGKVDPFAKPLLADISVQGQDFQVLNTAQARAWVTPDLRLVRDAKGATVTGVLTVPRADITPKGGLGGGGVEVSSDQVLVGAAAPPPQETLPVYADLKLVLGDKVNFEGYGLKTRIEGAVSVTQEPRRGALGRGELRLVDGHYKAYGQDLNIETGKLLFTGGPVTTPAVDIYATRKPREDITVGVRVRGTLAKPELTLQSSPTLPREQQLSWLVLGRSLETSSTQDRSLVSSAALSLGLGGGDYLAGLLGKKVGLDELSVGGAAGGSSEVAASSQTITGAQTGAATDANAQAAQLTLGKYLTPRLFISYGISLFQQGYSFRLLYTLGHGFKLATESGTASGGDLIYQTERGLRKPAPAADKPVATPADQATDKSPDKAPAAPPGNTP